MGDMIIVCIGKCKIKWEILENIASFLYKISRPSVCVNVQPWIN